MEIRINAQTAHKYSKTKEFNFNSVESIIDYIYIFSIYPAIISHRVSTVYKHHTDIPTEVIEYFSKNGYICSYSSFNDKSFIFIYW